jgi:cytochrome b6-f complex iron-sulfur subunit
MDPIIIGAIVLAVLAVAALGLALRNSDTSTAIGQLSGETIKRDRAVDVPEPDAKVSVGPGKEIEALGSARGRAALVAAETAPPVAYVPPDPETVGVARRQFLNRGILAMFGLGITGFGAASIGFLWPQGVSGFGSKVTVGRIPDIQAAITAGNGFFYVPEGRMWVTEYPASALEKASSQYGFYGQVEQGLQAGVTAIYQTCPHLGCRVPECATSQWFECPCHGSQYNRVGEKKGGPAPRGMDRFPMEVNAANELIVDTGTVIQGPPIGTNTTGQEAEGPNCISGAEEHS